MLFIVPQECCGCIKDKKRGFLSAVVYALLGRNLICQQTLVVASSNGYDAL